ncbi:hypothetical protein KAU09_05260 [Candidatus Parcubacteria bacterium]|nr:hypothetical protein [Candidatus Parcubacteria bacterium]
MIRKIGIFLVIISICPLGYYAYTGFTEPILLLIAAFLFFFGLFSMTIKNENSHSPKENKGPRQMEARRILKMIFFHFLAIMFFIFTLVNVGGEELGEINYWPVICLTLAIISFIKGRSYGKPFP